MEATSVPAAGGGTDHRRTVEFRAGLATATTAVTAVAMPILMLCQELLSDPLYGVVGALLFAMLVATLVLVGWWIDSIRTWWGDPPWRYGLPSRLAWVVPIYGIFASLDDGRTLLDSAGRQRWARRAWCWSWIAVIVLPWAESTWGPTVAAATAGRALLGLLPLILVTTSMASLRAAWSRQGAATSEPTADFAAD